MAAILSTERLSLRSFALSDALFIIELVNSPGWLEYIGDRNIKTVAQAEKYLKDSLLKNEANNGFGLWLVALKDSEKPIGMCGLIKRDYLPQPDIGFAFLPAFTGKGYAFEAANATIAYAKETLHLPTILAITLPTNLKSIHLLNKIGLQFSNMVTEPGAEEELMLFSN